MPCGYGHAPANVQQHKARKNFKALGIGQQIDAHDGPYKHARQCAQGNGKGQRPHKPPLVPVAPYARGTGQHVKELVGGADAGVGITQNAHLKRQQQKSARDAAHGCEKRDAKSHRKRNKRVALNACSGKIHAGLLREWRCN